MSVGEYTCNFLTTSEGSESTLFETFLHSPSVQHITAERKSPVKCREMQPSFEVENDIS